MHPGLHHRLEVLTYEVSQPVVIAGGVGRHQHSRMGSKRAEVGRLIGKNIQTEASDAALLHGLQSCRGVHEPTSRRIDQDETRMGPSQP